MTERAEWPDLVALLTDELRQLVHDGWSAHAQQRALHLADSFDRRARELASPEPGQPEPAREAAQLREALPDKFVSFLVGEFMRAGFHKGPHAAQNDARGIVERWNKRLATPSPQPLDVERWWAERHAASHRSGTAGERAFAEMSRRTNEVLGDGYVPRVATPTPEPLDVERLRKAIDLSGIGLAEGGHAASDWTEAIAAEYARLTEPSAESPAASPREPKP
jgi:hypothetical protein